MTLRSLEALDRILEDGGEADDVLRAVVGLLAAEQEIAWAEISFREGGELAPGPHAGVRDEDVRVRTPIVYDGDVVGELTVDGDADEAFLAGVADKISAHVLLGWDTGGVAWEP